MFLFLNGKGQTVYATNLARIFLKYTTKHGELRHFRVGFGNNCIVLLE